MTNDATDSPTAAETPETAAEGGSAVYRVLARKYRPSTFADLIGQESMVRTLTNALMSGRLAHAFLLTGVRGVGKTTTARIIARALNCIGADGAGGPTPDPCGVCEHCQAIADDRHVDVLEMDAASRTGVDDIRELIDGVRYRPTSARYKIYIVDEVHMLSRNAFNALLKTLEEPPEHVKFVFATTEVRKLPVTVVSRCQRFDLRRIESETLAGHFAAIADREGFAIDNDALHLITRAADGSVRDGLSLLDQAFAQADGTVSSAEVRDMLGLADRGQTFALLEAVFAGQAADALNVFAGQYEAGADPALLLADMLDIVHWLTRIKITPAVADAPGVAELERDRGRDIAQRLSMAVLARAWQMLMKGLGEVRAAPSPVQAMEMILVRLTYTADLPTPAAAVQTLTDPAGSPPPATSSPSALPSPAPSSSASPPAERSPPISPPPAADTESPLQAAAPPPAAASPAPAETSLAVDGPSAAVAPLPEEVPAPVAPPAPKADPQSFAAVVKLIDGSNARILHANVVNNVHLVNFEVGQIELRPEPRAPGSLANELSQFLNEHTDRRWVVTVSRDEGAPTINQQAESETRTRHLEAAATPLVKAVMEAFPGAEIEQIRDVSRTDSPPPEGDQES